MKIPASTETTPYFTGIKTYGDRDIYFLNRFGGENGPITAEHALRCVEGSQHPDASAVLLDLVQHGVLTAAEALTASTSIRNESRSAHSICHDGDRANAELQRLARDA